MIKFKEFLAEAATIKSLKTLGTKLLSGKKGDVLEYNGTKIEITDVGKDVVYCVVNPDADIRTSTAVYQDPTKLKTISLPRIEKLIKYGSKTDSNYYQENYAYMVSMSRYSKALAIYGNFNWKKYGIDVSKYDGDEDGLTIKTGVKEDSTTANEYKRALAKFEAEVEKVGAYVYTYVVGVKGKLCIEISKGELGFNDDVKVY